MDWTRLRILEDKVRLEYLLHHRYEDKVRWKGKRNGYVMTIPPHLQAGTAHRQVFTKLMVSWGKEGSG